MTQNLIERIKIDNTDIFLEDFGKGHGKISITNTYGYNYSMYWGSMGGSLKEFICQINPNYFSSKLLGSNDGMEMDVKKTFAGLRKHISYEIIPWYESMSFQSDMREKLNKFQERCCENNSEYYFIEMFYIFINSLDYYLIDKSSHNYIEKRFKDIDEPWSFIERKKNRETIWIEKLHSKLKNRLIKKI